MITLLVATRGRPMMLASMWASALAAADDPAGLRLVYRVDDDDPAGYPDDLPGHWLRVSGPRIVLSQAWNEAYAGAAILGNGPDEIFWHGGDDNLFRTPGWDGMVRQAHARFPDGIAFVHGRDGIQDARLGTHGFVTRRWVDASGFFVPPYFVSDYNDTWLTEVADAIGRRVYLDGMLIEHMHPTAGKAAWDLTHQERLARHSAEDPGALYARTAGERADHADRLRKAMGDS